MINFKRESVPISHQEDSQDKLNNFIFTPNFTFPDFFQTCKFSLTHLNREKQMFVALGKEFDMPLPASLSLSRPWLF